jgi:maintenance of morphology protein 1
MDFPSDVKDLLAQYANQGKATCQYVRTLSFMQGFLLGQFSVLIVVVFAIRYLLMEDVKRVKKVLLKSSSKVV